MPKNNKQKKGSSKINNPHDKFFRATFSMLTVVKGYFNEVFPQNLTDKLDLDTLVLDPNAYITKDLAGYYSDLVWRCQLKSGQLIQVAFLFEHKSFKPVYPHFQLLEYMLGAWRKQLENNEQLIQIIPIIVYHGIEKWEYLPFSSYFGETDEDLLRFMPQFDYVLTDLSNYSDEMILSFQTLFLRKIFIAFKHFLEKNFIQTNFVKIWLDGFSDIKSDELHQFIHLFGVYLSTISDTPDEIVHQQINSNIISLNHEAMNAVDSLFKKWKLEGKLEGKHESIITMWKKGHKAEFIADCLDIPLNEVKEVIEKFEKRANN